MRTKVLIVSVMALIVAGLFAVPEVAAQDVSDRHLVLFKGSGVPKGFVDDVKALGGSVVYSHKVGVAIVEGLTEDKAVELKTNKKVSAVERDVAFLLDPIPDGSIESAGTLGPYSPTDPSGAYFYPVQWNMRAIEAERAWNANRFGFSGVTVAILDTGIDYEHLDLIGLVDLSRSVSFVPLDDLFVDLFFPGKDYVTDLMFHGTHVAATVASNAAVAAGVTSQTTLMGVKVCDVFGSCSFGAVVQGILHAVDNGADVANMSLGGGFSKAGSKGLVGYINRLFNYANSAGMTIVVSAGNDAIDLDHNGNEYSTYCDAPNVICVSATAPTAGESWIGPWTEVDAPAPYTNYGRSSIHVAAPGGEEIANDAGWIWAACSQTSLWTSCPGGVFVLGLSGTSMAAPHVTGLAALVVEDVGRRPGQVRAKIQQSADDLGQPGTDPFYGKGRINVGTYATD